MTINETPHATLDSTTHSSPAEVVAGIYGAFGAGDMEGLFARLHDEIDWSVDVTAPGGDLVPMFRHGIGHAAVASYFGGVAQLEFHVFDIGRLLVDAEVVVAELHLEVSHRDTGKRATLDELHHWTVRDGLAVRFRPYVDTATLIELFRS